MEGDHIKNYDILLPLAWIYRFLVGVRNVLFDLDILRSRSFDVPVISVGNITVGGTGKTPHTEYLIRLLSRKHKVAVLSRGYKRRTRNFILATNDTPMSDIGDEPYQMKHKFPDVHIAVDRNRCHGIDCLMRPTVTPQPDVIILDDAYQHRYVKPSANILLMDYHRLVYYDRLLPAGRLREPISSMSRADIVVVTKCPLYITPMDRRGIELSLNLQPWQHLFFSTFRYGNPYQLWGSKHIDFARLADYPLLLFCAIASPKQLEYDISKVTTNFETLCFPDHHNFRKKDIEMLKQQANGRIVITTEKDAARLQELQREQLTDELAESIYVLPIEVEFMNERQEEFDRIVTNFVSK